MKILDENNWIEMSNDHDAALNDYNLKWKTRGTEWVDREM